ncbi:MAG TPA: hypothetical protein VNV42_08460 [Solirubrobacteraceae bacterium]|nr:hypothetical protein [Solirubrobacteraceae bacterium]
MLLNDTSMKGWHDGGSAGQVLGFLAQNKRAFAKDRLHDGAAGPWMQNVGRRGSNCADISRI